jgi:hypothetical protein
MPCIQVARGKCNRASRYTRTVSRGNQSETLFTADPIIDNRPSIIQIPALGVLEIASKKPLWKFARSFCLIRYQVDPAVIVNKDLPAPFSNFHEARPVATNQVV